jgi:hypothetical protein
MSDQDEFPHCDPDCEIRTNCTDAGKVGHHDCGRRPCGHPKHHVCECFVSSGQQRSSSSYVVSLSESDSELDSDPLKKNLLSEEGMYRTYRVTWVIDIDAPNPKAAAALALKIHRDKDSLAVVFGVEEAGKPETIQMIDLATPEEVMAHRLATTLKGH